MSNQYQIISWDFNRDDGLINTESQVGNNVQREEIVKQDDLVTKKITTEKINIEKLKKILKQPYNEKHYQDFYLIYGHKLIEMDFGLIELQNIKSDNIYNLNELQNVDKTSHFFRWDKLFNIDVLKEPNQLQDFVQAYNYYNLLIKERLMINWTLKNYKNDALRKSFPFKQLYVFDLVDTVTFKPNYMSQQDSLQFQDLLKTQIETDLIQLKLLYFKQLFGIKNLQIENMIFPFILQQEECIFFTQLKWNQAQNQYDIILIINESYNDRTNQLISFVKNYLQYFTNVQINQDSEVQFLNKVSNSSLFSDLLGYIKFIEDTFFQSKFDFKTLFEELPRVIHIQRQNYPLPLNIAIPQKENVTSQY